jgi:tetratricopeptide (TPR) repeat protein/2-polyprenyl-3-methyl-5-hydroxy-6-metoxy-1,4-benzoquinol methylase
MPDSVKPAVAELFTAAIKAHQAGILGEAERQYRGIIALDPGHANSLHNLGLIALHAGHAAEAADLISRAIAADNTIAEYHYNVALSYHALNRLDEAAAHLERAIAMRTNYPLAELNLGNIRREQGRFSEAASCYERVIALTPNMAPAHFNLANVFAAQTRWDEAAEHYKKAVAFQPNHAQTYAGLGAALLAQGKIADAIDHLRKALNLEPRLFDAYHDLARSLLAAGDLESAIDTSTKVLTLAETEQNKALFAHCVKYARFTSDNEQFRALLVRATTEGWTRPRELSAVTMSLIKHSGVMKDCIARVNASWPARLSAEELFGRSVLEALARDRLLCTLLESNPSTDIEVERVLANVRYAALMSGGIEGTSDEAALRFYCAIAQQCFVNEYVFSVTEAEQAEALRLRSQLEQALSAGDPFPAHWLILVAAYFPLHDLANAEALLERSWPPYIEALLTQQIREPVEERRIAAGIPALTAVDSETSRVVRQQYEENPYPRWVRAGAPGQPGILFGAQFQQKPERPLEILIAGCGTGLSTIEFARHASNASILAVDLSLASLSYAKRMAHSLTIANVEFAQADIMEFGSIGRTFDFIDVSGVLHHMADPWQGWRVLLSLLRPGGTMQVGLYSELARQHVVAARKLIAERGYQASYQGIRRCREDIVATNDPLLWPVMQFSDFFSTSECRDLLFHVQEQRTSLPEIKSFLAANGLTFAGFVPEAATLRAFTERFSEREALTDLDCWHAFEIGRPETFASMYQFWVRKLAV